MQLKSIKEVKNLKGKKVLIRLDLDVPVEDDGRVHEDEEWRLQAAMPTLKYVLRKGAEIIIVGHRGRPGGNKVSRLTLKPIVDRFAQLFDNTSGMSEERVGQFEAFSFLIGKKWITILENIRFHPGETRNNSQLAKKLASIADIYVNDAFAVSHRDHASLTGITRYLPSYAGLHMVKEVYTLSHVLHRPRRPLTLIIGGAKASTKLPVIERFLPRADYILIGTALAHNFYDALGYDIGASKFELGMREALQHILERPQYTILKEENKQILLDPKKYNTLDAKKLNTLKKRVIMPFDLILGKTNKKDHITKSDMKKVEVALDNKKLVPPGYSSYDIGPKSLALYQAIIKRSGTVLWNGPMGMFERPPYDYGTYKIAKSVAEGKCKAIIGGGDTVAAIESKHVTFKKNVFLSTGGGAMLEFLVNPRLPGIKPLIKKK